MSTIDDFDGSPHQQPEPQDTMEDFVKDDLHLRTLTTLIQKLRNSAKMKVNLDFTDHPIPKTTIATCKWSFLLVRDAEVVAASPTKASNEIAITQTVPIPCETEGQAFNQSDGKVEALLITRNARNNDLKESTHASRLWIVKPPTSQISPNWNSALDFLQGAWNLCWEDHSHFVVSLLNIFLRAVRSRKAQLRSHTKALLLSYLIVSATAKNGRRLLERLATPELTYYDMMFDDRITKHIREFRYFDTVLPYPTTVLPAGGNTFLTSIFDDEDRRILLDHAMDAVETARLPAITSKFSNLRYNFFEFLRDDSRYRERELDQWMVQSFMEAFWELIKALLDTVKKISIEVKEKYPVGGNKTPESEDIQRISKDLYVAHKIMDHFLFRSKVLNWFINNIISAHFLNVAGIPKKENDNFPEHQGQVDDLFDDFQSDPVTRDQSLTDEQMEAEAQLRRFWNWIQLSFSTFRYLDSILKELRPLPAGKKIMLNIIATNQCSTQLKDWHEVLREAYPSDPSLKKKTVPKATPEKPTNVPWTVVDILQKQAKTEKEQSANGKLSWMRFWEHKGALLFRGQRHAEAILATIILLKKRREAGLDVPLLSDDDWPILDSLGPIDNIVGPSKPCCPVCTQVLERVSEAVAAMGETRLAPPHSHSLIFGSAFPPFLPRDIRRDVLRYFQQVLREVIASLENKFKSQDGTTSPSALSDQSAAWTQSSIASVVLSNSAILSDVMVAWGGAIPDIRSVSLDESDL